MGFFDSLGQNLLNALSWVIYLLPDSPFLSIANTDVSDFMSGLNWILPLTQIIAILEAWITCVIIFYAYQVILRWVKAL